MKNILTNIGILAMVGVSALTTGCRESFDYEEAYRANPEFVYRENFEKAFGKIDPNQSWDFTKGGKSVSLTRAGESEVIHITSTTESQYHDGDRVQNAALVKNGAIGIVSGRLAYENEHILAGSKPFALQTKGKFGICPIWRWACMSKYNLQIIGIPADGSIPKIYEIDYGVLMKAISSKQGDATEPSFVYNGGDASGSWQGFILDFEPGSFVVFKLVDKNGNWESSNYLDITGNFDDKEMTKAEGYLTIVAFDDAKGDHDYNDLVLLTYDIDGEGRPEIITDESVTTVSKRYMVEDLGAVDGSDIDFNDIVIDLTTTSTITLVKVYDKDGNLVSIMPSDPEYTEQKAEVIALGGTLNISVEVDGQKFFEKQGFREVTSMYQTGDPGDGTSSWSAYSTEVMKEYDLSENSDYNNPWVPSENNITVLVDNKNEAISVGDDLSSSNAARVIHFPIDGELPYMIATPVSQKFNAEKKSVLIQGSESAGYYFHLSRP